MFAIGDKEWPGISKLVEEAGEVLQVCGKLIALGGDHLHWDGTTLKERLEEEIADLSAAIEFVVDKRDLDLAKMTVRASEKRRLFEKWHEEGRRAKGDL